MPTPYSAIRRISLALGLAFGLTGGAHAKTIMWLADWYGSRVDSVSIVKVYVPHYATTATGTSSGYYYGTSDLVLSQTSAYARPIPVHSGYDTTGLSDSLKIPLQLNRWWYALPNWNSANFYSGEVNVIDTAKTFYHTYMTGPPQHVQLDVGAVNGQTGQLNQSSSSKQGWVDHCVDSLKSDTIWIKTKLDTPWTNYAGENNLACYDHNPFFTLVGTVHVFNPWPGKTPYLQFGTTYYQTYPDSGRPGWYSTKLYSDSRNVQPFKVRVASGSTSSAQYLDAGGLNGNATGVFYDFTTTPGLGGEVWITPPLVASTSTISTTAPPVKLKLYIQDPAWSATTVRSIWKGVDAKFIPVSTKYCEWFIETFYQYGIPESIVLRQPLADTLFGSKGQETAPTSMGAYANWIDLSSVVNAGTAYLSTSSNVSSVGTTPPKLDSSCATKTLAFSAYDYATAPTDTNYAYRPFMEGAAGFKVYYTGTTTSTDNCPDAGGGAIKGLVSSTLNAKGRPNWTGKIDCDIGASSDGPQWWYDSLWKNGTGGVTGTASYGKTRLNQFHCVRVPLILNDTGYYSYASGSFFPLDTASNMSAPFWTSSSDFHFAMHAKASFEYTTGLKFSFSGDDDVWIYIDKKLALDLGGQHSAVAGGINLDALGLVEGKSYQFDMFYNERHTVGSSISISTTMNLVPTIDVSFDSSSTSTGKNVTVYTTETTTRSDICPEEGAATTSTKRLGNAAYSLLFPDGSTVSLDSTSSSSYPGIVISGANSHISIDTAALKKSGKLTESGLYQIWMDIGNESDSIISFTVISQTVDVNGVLHDRNGDGHADSVELHVVGAASGFKNIASATLIWADSSGATDSVSVPGASFAVASGDSVATATFPPLPFRTSCPSGGCTGSLGIVYTTQGGDTLKNKIKVLADGIAPVADSAWLVYDSTGSAWDTLYVVPSEPVQVSTATPLASVAAWVLAGQTRSPRLVTQIGTISSTGLLIKIAFDPSSNPLVAGDSIRLGGKLSDPLGNAVGDSSRWVPLHANSVARSWMLDKNGDGTPDSIGVGAKGDFSTATNVVVNWKTAAGVDTAFTVAVSGLGTGFSLPSGILANATYCSGCTIEVNAGSTLIKKITLLDSVAPVAVSAKLVYGFESGAPDTLTVTGSEALALSGTNLVLLNTDSSNTGAYAPTAATVLSSGLDGKVTLKLIVSSGAISDNAAWARFGTSVSDVGGAKVGASSSWVKLLITPSGRATLYDSDGDGRADSVQIVVHGALSATTAKVVWTTAAGTTDTRTWPVASTSNSFGLHPTDSSLWFQKGATSCPTGNCSITFSDASGKIVAQWTLVDSVAPMAVSGTYAFGTTQDTLRVTFSEALKSVSDLSSWVEWGNAGSTASGAVTHASAVLNASGIVATLVLDTANGATARWDSVRIATGTLSGKIVDANGTKAGTTSPWAPLSYGLPPVTVAVSDPNGLGQGTNLSVHLVRAVVQSAIDGIDSVRVVWNGESRDIAVGELTWNSAALSWSGAIGSPFALGATAYGTVHGAQAVAKGGSVRASTLIDSVPPTIVRARYRFSQAEVAIDTFVADLSEPWEGEALGNDVDPFLTVKRPSNPLALAPMEGWDLSSDGTTLQIVLDTTWESKLSVGDSARLAHLDAGSRIWDAFGNRVGAISRWVPIEFGLRPAEFKIQQVNPILSNKGDNSWTEPAADVPSVEFLVKQDGNGSWVRVDENLQIGTSGSVEGGSAAKNDANHVMGIYLKLNRPLTGTLFIYDNIGTSVDKVDLSPLAALWATDDDALREVRITWNGTSPNHKFAATGVYLMRIVIKVSDGAGGTSYENLVWKYGWQRGTK